MDVSHFFKIVQIVPNRPKRLIWFSVINPVSVFDHFMGLALKGLGSLCETFELKKIY